MKCELLIVCVCCCVGCDCELLCDVLLDRVDVDSCILWNDV
ncbi:hypothetical protein LINPERPRIM_LOCUS30694 [Linum perenne]